MAGQPSSSSSPKGLTCCSTEPRTPSKASAPRGAPPAARVTQVPEPSLSRTPGAARESPSEPFRGELACGYVSTVDSQGFRPSLSFIHSFSKCARRPLDAGRCPGNSATNTELLWGLYPSGDTSSKVTNKRKGLCRWGLNCVKENSHLHVLNPEPQNVASRGNRVCEVIRRFLIHQHWGPHGKRRSGHRHARGRPRGPRCQAPLPPAEGGRSPGGTL